MVRRLLAVAAALLGVLAAGIWLGGRHPEAVPGPVRGALVGDTESRVVLDAIDEVQGSFYRQVPTRQLADLAIEGLVDGLDDRFSTYFSPAEYKRVKQAQNGEFSGIGVQVTRLPADEERQPLGLLVRTVFDDSPADRAGVREGDRIVAVGGRSLRGVDQDDAVRRIKGPNGTEVQLTLQRGERRLERTIRRATVSVPVVATQLERSGATKVGVVALGTFSSGAHAQVYEALRTLGKQGARAYVLDLRGNGGGFVTEAQLVASAFLRDGPIVTTRGRGVRERTLRATGDPLVPRAPVVVLVDRDTASASEIVAGALQDRDRATVVGTTTFGKGVFQEVIELRNGGALDITAGRYFTPDGRNLGGKGISPDVEARDDLSTERRDEALQRALSTVAARA